MADLVQSLISAWGITSTEFEDLEGDAKNVSAPLPVNDPNAWDRDLTDVERQPGPLSQPGAVRTQIACLNTQGWEKAWLAAAHSIESDLDGFLPSRH